MPDIALRFGRDMLVCEGAMGTMLQSAGMPAGECPEYLNVLDPEMVMEVHRYYRIAGADIAVSNTFGGTRHKLSAYGLEDRLAELNMAGVRIAKRFHPEHVFADVGPCGLVMKPAGEATFDEVFAQYFEQITALVKAGPEAILIETMTDIADARCAVLAAQAVCDLPVLVTCTFNEKGVMDLSGTDPETAAIVLEAVGAKAVGINCGLGPEQIYPLLCRMAKATALPLVVQPNAGMPHLDRSGKTVYPLTPDEMGDWAVKFRAAGAQIIGSCCGSTPAFSGMIAAEISDLPVVPRPDHAELVGTMLAGPRGRLRIGGDELPCIMGERINPTGKPDLAEELRGMSMSMVRSFAIEQEAAGASLLDVNVGAPDVDEKAALCAAIGALGAITSLPLSLDTTDRDALEQALRIYPGRALINSCNGEESSYSAILPLAKRYGAAVVVLALDDNGIPETVEERLAIVERVRKAAHVYGLSDSDLVVDMLTMTSAVDAHSAEVTLRGVQALHEQGITTILGVSNISHGMPDRALLNAAFLDVAVQAGLDVAIANPCDGVMADALRTASDERDDDGGSYDAAYNRWHQAYEAAVAKAASGIDDLTQGDSEESLETISARSALENAVLRGDVDAVADLVERTIEEGTAAESIVSEILTPAMQGLGDSFERGETFLPQMIVAANAMKAAVTQVKTHLPASTASGTSGTVLFCTVQGDIHSIGKDICISLLESQDFRVIDLGVDVPPEKVLQVARDEHVDCVCLSALMTTTLPAMKETVALLQRELPEVDVLVGGAVVTLQWAASIGAQYSDDAPSCVEHVRGQVTSSASEEVPPVVEG